MAAAVLEVGKLELSPQDHTLGNFLCYIVSLQTSTYPVASANPLFLIYLGAV